jgi:flagellar biosynthesis/type III secretory pathway protein FliH
MADRFVSLASLLRPQPEPPIEPASAAADTTDAAPVVPPAAAATPPEMLTECKVFRARLLDAFDHARAKLVQDLAAEVLGRELELAPPAIDVLAARLIENHAEEIPVRLRVSPADRERVRIDLPIDVDPSLRSGDLVLIVRDGMLESTLGLRLEGAVRAALT